MNRNEYESGGYAGSGYRPAHNRSPYPPPAYRQAAASLAPSSRNDYDVDSMLSSRSLAAPRDYGWPQHRSLADGPYGRRGSDASRLRSQYTRASPPPPPPFRDAYDPKLDQSPTRREYSPLRKVSKGLDGVFKGFTTPLPGNDPGYLAEAADLVDHSGSVRTPSSRRYSEVDRASLYRGLSAAGSVSAPHLGGGGGGHDLYGQEPHYRYRGGVEYAATNPAYAIDDYPPEPTSRYLPEAGKRYGEPAAGYAAPSVAGGRRSADCYQPWHSAAVTPPPPPTACWDGMAMDVDQASPRMAEQPLSPRTFKRECQRAFKEARAQRMRNLEEGLYGKCDWATFDAKYC